MSDDSNAGERVLLYILVGIGIFGLAYLFFKDQFRRDSTTQSIGLGSLGLGSERLSSQLGLGNTRIDELEKQTIDLEMQTNMLKERLKLYDYKLSQFDNSNQNGLNEIPRTYTLSGNNFGGQPSRAGSVTTVRSSVEDKIRQKDFGMI